MFVAGIYGGYFGAAQGIMLLSILALSLNDDLQRINALKVVLAGLVNLVAGIVFVIAAHVAWGAALLIAVGSVIGGFLGARYGKRLPEDALRAVIVVVGIFAIVRLLRVGRPGGPARSRSIYVGGPSGVAGIAVLIRHLDYIQRQRAKVRSTGKPSSLGRRGTSPSCSSSSTSPPLRGRCRRFTCGHDRSRRPRL